MDSEIRHSTHSAGADGGQGIDRQTSSKRPVTVMPVILPRPSDEPARGGS